MSGVPGGDGEAGGYALPSSHRGRGLHLDGDAGCWGDGPRRVPRGAG